MGANWTTTIQQRYNLKSYVLSALLFVYGSNVTLMNVKISDAKAAGFCIYNVGGSVIVDYCKVENALSTRRNVLGGNIIAYDSQFAMEKASLHLTNSTIIDSGINQCNGILLFSAGLSIFIQSDKLTIHIAHMNFTGNMGCNGGNMAVSFNHISPVTISHTIFNGGYSLEGGGVLVGLFVQAANNGNVSELFSIANSTFTNNVAEKDGGGIRFRFHPYIPLSPLFMNIRNTSFIGNSAATSGSAIEYLVNTIAITDDLRVSTQVANLLISNCTFSKHTKKSLGTQFQSTESVIYVLNAPHLEIDGITLDSNNSTAIVAVNSLLVFSGSTKICNNRAANGAGIQLVNAFIEFTPNTDLIIINNKAEHKGGGIKIYNYPGCISYYNCFYRLNAEFNKNNSFTETVNFTVADNSAPEGGSNLFNGNGHNNENCAKSISLPRNTVQNPSSVTSDPQQVCIRNIGDDCHTEKNITIYPGQEVTFNFYMVGQWNGLVAGVVSAETPGSAKINDGQKSQKIPLSGKNITYTIYSSQASVNTSNTAVIMVQSVQKGCTDLHQAAEIKISFKDCPLGFINTHILTNARNFACQCFSNFNCSIGLFGVIEKSKYSWVGMLNWTNHSCLAANDYCPLDYCSPSSMNITSYPDYLDQDEQCQYNRTGILCGSCPEGWSLVLGSSECREKCSNVYLLLILPIGLAGLLLLLLIHFLNLTVTMGTVCGLIFYTNIIQDYSVQFLSENPIPGLTQILQIFLSWFNLDLGFSTCFYDGMEAFGKTILQFVFPIYIWFISITIIFLSNRYIFFTRWVGENAVKILSTLFLLSYSKMLRATIGALNIKVITVYLNSTAVISKMRWALDGNVSYFDEKHLVLLAIAVLFTMLLLPFSVSLLCIRHVYSLSNCCKVFSFFDKLKPFFDTYTGPFKDNARFWTGLLLFVRLLVLILHTADYKNRTIPYYIIIAVFILLLMFMIILQGVYKKQYLNILEQFFISNISIIFLVNSFIGGPDTWKSITSHILVSSTFLVFLGIVAYHVYLQLSHHSLTKRLACWRKRTNIMINYEDIDDERTKRSPKLFETC